MTLGAFATDIEIRSHVDAEARTFVTIRERNLLYSLSPVVEGAGFKADTNPAVLTDGRAFDEIAKCSDGSSPRETDSTCTILTYALHTPSDIDAIRVFSRWPDIRAYQCYDVDVGDSTSGKFRPLCENVRVGGPTGALPSITAGLDGHYCVSVVMSTTGKPLAEKIHQIRFTFWGPGMQDSSRVSRFRARGAGHDGSFLSEIEVFPPGVLKRSDADSE